MIFIQALWLILPAGFSNMSPVLAKKVFPRWNTPIDFNFRFYKNETFGSHKTFRGFIIGTLTGLFIFYIQQKLNDKSSLIKSISLLDYNNLSPLFGLGLGFSALMGDLIKSFFKRRINISPGKPWIPFDEIDWVVGVLFYINFYFKTSWQLILACLLVGLFFHFVIRRLAYILHFVSSPL